MVVEKVERRRWWWEGCRLVGNLMWVLEMLDIVGTMEVVVVVMVETLDGGRGEGGGGAGDGWWRWREQWS